MNSQTQANRLATLMAKKNHLPSYELALPLVTVRSSELKLVEAGDIFLLGVRSLECILIEDGTIRATVLLDKLNNRYCLRVQKIQDEKIQISEHKKYETLRFSLAKIQSRVLTLGHTIHISQVDMEHITVIHNKKEIATGILVNVEDELAVQIDKVK